MFKLWVRIRDICFLALLIAVFLTHWNDLNHSLRQEQKMIEAISGKITYFSASCLDEGESAVCQNLCLESSFCFRHARFFIHDPRGLNRGSQAVKGKGVFLWKKDFRNPSQSQDKLFATPPAQVRIKMIALEETIPSFHCKVWFRSRLKKISEYSTLLYSFLALLWTGDRGEFPEASREELQHTGLLHVLAISGQHVLALRRVLRWTLVLGLWWLTCTVYGKYFFLIEKLVSLLAIVFLFKVSNEEPSVLRYLLYFSGSTLILTLPLMFSQARLILAVQGAILLWNPLLMLSPGYLLSAVLSYWQSSVLETVRGVTPFRTFLMSSFCIYVLAMPVTMHLFTHLSWSSLLFQWLLAWMWDLVLIPFFFVFTLLLFVSPEPFLFALNQWGDWILNGYFSFQTWLVSSLGTYYSRVPNLSLIECLSVEVFLAFLLKRLSDKIKLEWKSKILSKNQGLKTL